MYIPSSLKYSYYHLRYVWLIPTIFLLAFLPVLQSMYLGHDQDV